ncbi:MAG: methionyl-tRNA formyltransferase [Syntrophales bacterium]|nr:methionyl-tRNA formyltransferase [Syntrophales bacterium]MDD5641498.1 methionyl-tRNA formyltransferase [Syntrophales bacterium]
MNTKPWRLIFMGTPQFAVPSLEALLAAGEEVAAVVTQPDKPRGRGRKVSPSPVKELALAWNLPVLQPRSLKDPDFVAALRADEPELMVVVAYGRILTPEILALPPVGVLNVHASLLPCYRGPAPINWALIRGDKETGVTIQWLKYEVDTGEIFLQERLPILEEDNAGTLGEKLSARGAVLLVQALEMLRRGEAVREVQDEAQVTYAPLLIPEMRRINWKLLASEVANWIRGLDPRPGAYTLSQGKVLRVFGARRQQELDILAAPGTALRLLPQGLEIACGRGSITVQELQLAGHKRLAAAEFLRGNPLINQVLG